jgi:nucleotide-binding universal stress UspA family protein
MVVMRTHGRFGVERAVLGSVADQVLAHCPVPVVLMRPGERRVTGIHTLLVPVDGSAGNDAALHAAVGLAQTTGARVKVVQVTVPLAMQSMVVYDYDAVGYYDSELDDEASDSARSYVDGLVQHLRAQGLDADGETPTAPGAAAAIVDVAQKNAADLIIMSTRGLIGPARTLLGSVANEVVRSAHCPVVLLRETEELAAAAPMRAAS